jgi:hypothetical protein
MSSSKTWMWCAFAFALGALVSVGGLATVAQSPRFSSLYTNLKTECQPAIKLKRGEELEGDMPLRCKGYGGYEIRVGYSAMSSQFSINRIGSDSEDVVVSTMQPLNYDLKRKVEWRLANGKPFAVIYRIDLTKGTTADADMWSAENKTGESLVVKSLKGFEEIEFEIDAKNPQANVKAREMADSAYAAKITRP